MTTHPEDAMTRERALEEAARLADEHNWSRVHTMPCPEDFKSGLGDKIRALASAQQEPAPSADAEGVITLERICELESLFQHDEIDSHHIREMLDALDALRRYAGDGVTDEMVEAAWKEFNCSWLDKAHVRAALEAAARAKPSEKGGADV